MRDFIASEYDELILCACLLVASIIAVRRRFGVASILMVASSGVLLITFLAFPLLLLYLPSSVPLEALDPFPWRIVLRTSKVFFGLSFVWFMIQQWKANGTQTI